MASTSPVSARDPLALVPTRTSGHAPDLRDVGEAATPPTVDTHFAFDVPLAGDFALREAPSRVDVIDVVGLGPLGSSGPALEARAAKLVRGQGLRAARLSVEIARRSIEDLDGIAARRGDENSRTRAKELRGRLDVLEGALARASAERERVKIAVTPKAVDRATMLLEVAVARVAAMRALYLSGDPDALRSLRTDAGALVEARGRIERASEAQRAEAVAAYEALHAEVAWRNPPLAPMTPSADLATLIDFARTTKTIITDHDAVEVPRPLDQPLRAHLDRTQAAIESMRDRLRSDPESVWELPAVIEATLIAEGAPDAGMVAAHARDIVRDIRTDDRLTSTFLAIATMGLGILAALPSGGTSLAVALTPPSAADAYNFGHSLVAYQRGCDAADSGLSAERPNPLAVLADGAFLALGALGAATASARALRSTPTVRGQTGGGLLELAADDWAAAERAYEAIRANEADVAAIAEHLAV